MYNELVYTRARITGGTWITNKHTSLYLLHTIYIVAFGKVAKQRWSAIRARVTSTIFKTIIIKKIKSIFLHQVKRKTDLMNTVTSAKFGAMSSFYVLMIFGIHFGCNKISLYNSNWYRQKIFMIHYVIFFQIIVQKTMPPSLNELTRCSSRTKFFIVTICLKQSCTFLLLHYIVISFTSLIFN